jgi:hypothetical protein
MGRTSIFMTLERTPEAGSMEELREVVLGWLGHQWDDILGKKQADEPWGWVSLGRDSLLTVGDYEVDQDAPTDELEFWFYRNVDWPMGWAEHLLLGALVAGHQELNDNLEPIGYRIPEPYADREYVAKQHETMERLPSPCAVCDYLSKVAGARSL